MSSRPLSQRHKADGHRADGTLPLINIVLLLVLAFMIAGTVTAPLPENFTPLQSESGETLKDHEDVLVLSMTQQGDVLRDGALLQAAEVSVLLQGRDVQEAGLVVRADARVPAGLVMALLAEAEAAGIEKATLVTLDRSG